jgi:hypothetical protein
MLPYKNLSITNLWLKNVMRNLLMTTTIIHRQKAANIIFCSRSTVNAWFRFPIRKDSYEKGNKVTKSEVPPLLTQDVSRYEQASTVAASLHDVLEASSHAISYHATEILSPCHKYNFNVMHS